MRLMNGDGISDGLILWPALLILLAGAEMVTWNGCDICSTLAVSGLGLSLQLQWGRI